MKSLISALLLIAFVSAASAGTKTILLYQRVEGNVRHCVYDGPNGRFTLTLPAGQACPLKLG